MKRKFLEFFAVSLLTLGLLIPSLLIANLIWQKHLEFTKTQHWIEVISEYEQSDVSINMNYTFERSAPGEIISGEVEYPPFPDQTLTSFLLTTDQEEAIANVLIGFIFSVPFGFCLGAVWYKQYSLYRANRRQQQIEFLERLWQ